MHAIVEFIPRRRIHQRPRQEHCRGRRSRSGFGLGGLRGAPQKYRLSGAFVPSRPIGRYFFKARPSEPFLPVRFQIRLRGFQSGRGAVAANVCGLAGDAVQRPEPCARFPAAFFGRFAVDVAHRPIAAAGGAVLADFVWGQSEAGLTELQRHPVAVTQSPHPRGGVIASPSMNEN